MEKYLKQDGDLEPGVRTKLPQNRTIADFPNNDTSNWYIVNDGVMGGTSSSSFFVDGEGCGRFSGHVSLQNNGGFASVKHQFAKIPVIGFQHISLRIKGDGKRYQLRLKPATGCRHAYISHFETNGQWQDLIFPLGDFHPTFKGRELDLPNFESDFLEEIGFLIANKQAESFQLLIDRIELIS